jgi:polyisoprenoid-binding protein YceI
MKISNALSIFFICISPYLFAQGKYVTKTGEITFEASVPSFEEVKAKNTNVSAILNTDTGEFAALALIKGFRFKVALMEEHFNENYIESSKYPKATFKGKINDFDVSTLSEEKKEYKIVGTLNMHGEDKLLETPVKISLIDNSIVMNLDFILKPEDFKIKIPGIVSSKIAEEVNVLASYTLKK